MSKRNRIKKDMRRALLVGINYYKNGSSLFGCVNDAQGMAKTLSHHFDGSPNFATKVLAASGNRTQVRRKELKKEVIAFFERREYISLFYFAGHGHREMTGGYLVTSDTDDLDEGLPIRDLIDIASSSPALNKIIILDCCHSGVAASIVGQGNFSILPENLTILAASKANQYANEDKDSNHGVFTNLLIDAINGSASNFQGDITLSSIYAHIDQSMGPLEQRPVFKANTTEYVSIKRVAPKLTYDTLRNLNILFQSPDAIFELDPSFEMTNQPGFINKVIEPFADPANVKLFSSLQKLASVGLVKPLNESHMYFAAMKSGKVMLTQLGKYYWKLIKQRVV